MSLIQCAQTMDPKDEDKFDFDPLDVTKIWPEHLFPLQPVGRMVLNKNPDNFFNENEQLAFCPALIVPGQPRLLLLNSFLATDRIPSSAPCASLCVPREGHMKQCRRLLPQVHQESSPYIPLFNAR